MSVRSRRRKCLHCGQLFTADYRNAYHQRYCHGPSCRQASHKASQRQWRRKPENRDVVRGPHEVERVREWRREHPDYWKRTSGSATATQPVDPHTINTKQRSRNVPPSPPPPLQDVCLAQDPAFVGLISLMTGSTLREDIASTTRQLLLRGQNILGLRVPLETILAYDRQTSDSSGAAPPGAQ
jgi:hypothetical protein